VTQTGQNVQAVRDAIEAMRTGKGTYDDLKTAVHGRPVRGPPDGAQ
jgi:hypothetical protein